MRTRRLTMLAAACALVTAAATAAPHTRTGYRAIDGDTFQVHATGERVRLFNIDAPELHPCRCDAECDQGARAKRTLQDMLDVHAVTISRIAVDVYGRTVAAVAVDSHDVGDWLIASGLARPYHYPQRRRPWC